MAYNHKKIESKWQKIWEKKKVWRAIDPPRTGKLKKLKYYSLIEFPYPSGDGLHVGHIRSNTAMDIISRKRRMEGYNVLYPIGWDAFGLPTENYAIKTGISPQKATKKNTDTFRKQLKKLGFSFDWSREINTTDPQYYKWTQWIFLQLFKHGLAYKKAIFINWCAACQIGLSNEEVVNGLCERCGGSVEKKLKSQWLLRITAYADKLLEGLNQVDFLEEIKSQQRNWIGRSEGQLIKFPIHNSRLIISVFTTRPDTIDGATYVVLAPEHPLVASLLEVQDMKGKIRNKKEVQRYIQKTNKRSDLERQENKKKTGVELKGIKAINPYNKEKIPIWISDYVLLGYGTGAIMAVPAHDERDKEFADKFNLPIKDVPFVPEKKWPGEFKVSYKLKDWIFSRQRYWGEPIPIIICERCGYVPVPEKDLPVVLPEVKNYQPRTDGQSPLASVKEWVSVKCPACKGRARRETDTMPNWAGSSWYSIAYVIRKNSKFKIQNSKLMKYWLPVDWYNGGMEHTTLHLLYSRFWNIFLHDIGVVPYSEPYKKRTAHGMILGEGHVKMSKSRGNVVNPDALIKEFGADSLRLYEMFIGPFGEAKSWNPRGIAGMSRFLHRVYDLGIKVKKSPVSKGVKEDRILEKLLHQTIKKVSEDIEEMKFNTAISALMIFLNELEKREIRSSIPSSYFIFLLKMLFPFAPHLAQELYSPVKLLDYELWPQWNERLLAEDTFVLVIQINGKVRATVTAKIGISKKEARKLAQSQKIIQKWLKGEEVEKAIFVPNKLINFIK